MRDVSQVGNKLLPKIIHAVSQVIISTRRNLAPLDHHVRVKATWDVFSRIGEELAAHYGPMIDLMTEGDTSNVHPAVMQWLADTRSGTDQAKAISGLLFGAGTSAISTFLSNELAPLVYRVVSLNPNLDLDPATAANAVVENIVPYADGANAAASQGYADSRFQVLVELAKQYPGAADALELRRRGLIDAGTLNLFLERSGMPEIARVPYAQLTQNELSLADAALAYLRSDIGLAEAQAIAHANGFTNEQLTIFLGNVGEPLGLEQLLEAYRREFIDQAEVERGIKQSRVRNEWIPTALKLAFAPITVADAVNANVQGYITPAEVAAIAKQNGLESGQSDLLIKVAGEPLSRTELEELYNRGLISQADVEQGLRESRLKNKYVADAFALHVKLLEPRMLSSAVEVGALTHDEAIKRALEQGYSDADAQVLVNEGSNRKLLTRRNEVLTAAETLYEDNAIDEAQLRAAAKAAGFDVTETDEIVKVAEYRREARWVSSVITVIRSKYVGHHITKSQATGYLDSLGMPAARRDQLLVIWDMERAASTKQLTEAQIAKALKLQLISPENALERLIQLGYSAGDAALLLKGA